MDNTKIVVNDGALANVNENDIQDIDPTNNTQDVLSKLNLCSDITFGQIYSEMIQFINNNKQILKYPKLFIKGKKPKCTDKHCKQCNNGNNENNNGVRLFSVCEIKRREMADQLFEIGQTRNCLSNSLTETMSRLCINDNILIYRSEKYNLVSNWFCKIFSFLKCTKK